MHGPDGVQQFLGGAGDDFFFGDNGYRDASAGGPITCAGGADCVYQRYVLEDGSGAAVSIIWKLQAAGVVVGHVLAVSVAHIMAVARFGATRAALFSQLPLAALMVGYTLFGLWLLAAPTAG